MTRVKEWVTVVKLTRVRDEGEEKNIWIACETEECEGIPFNFFCETAGDI